MSIHQVFPQQYQAQLDQKVDKIKTAFDHFNLPEIEVFASPSSHYRLRAEFKIWHEDGCAHYAMFEPGERKRPFIIDRKSTRLNSSHVAISYAVFCLKKKSIVDER